MINFYKTKNLALTKEFYEKLGLSIYFENENSIILDSLEGMIGFVFDSNATTPSYSCVSFDLKDTQDVDNMYEKLKDVALATPSKHSKFPVYSFFLIDPNGINIEYQTILK